MEEFYDSFKKKKLKHCCRFESRCIIMPGNGDWIIAENVLKKEYLLI